MGSRRGPRVGASGGAPKERAQQGRAEVRRGRGIFFRRERSSFARVKKCQGRKGNIVGEI